MGHAVAPSLLPAVGKYTMENTLLEMKETSLVLRLLVPIVKLAVGQRYDGRRSELDPTYRFLLASALDSPMRAAVMCGEGALSERAAQAIVNVANRRFLRALRGFFKR